MLTPTVLEHESPAEPTVKQTREILPEGSRHRSTSLGVAYFGVTALVYAANLGALVAASNWLARIALALVNGLTIGSMFIVGHDACHGSLTPNSRINKWLGRIAFLPSLHPFAAWEYSHNALHHGWTNLRGRDPVYAPRTVAEFNALPLWRRRLERLYRSWPGLLPLYLATIWWPLEIAPTGDHRQHIDKRGTFQFDRALVGAYALAQCALIAWHGHVVMGASAAKTFGLVVTCTALPFVSFAWLMAFATLQHHTNPRVMWYADEREWTYFRSQVEGTVHIVFPRWIEVLLHHIMEHTAHHIDTRVPLYNLDEAQQAVERAFGVDHVISESFTLRLMTETFRRCQLYDYDRHQWLTFDGVPTTEPRIIGRPCLGSA